MVERANRAPVGTFYAPGAWAAIVELDEAATHHVQVKRLRAGDTVRLTSGHGRRARGTLSMPSKGRASVEIDVATVEHVSRPPILALLAPVSDRERMLLLAEKSVELGLSAWYPVLYRRSRSVSPRGEGDAFQEKVRLRMIAALEQSGGTWLPELHAECGPEDARNLVRGMQRILLDGDGLPLSELRIAPESPCAIALGPEGGLDGEERDDFTESGWRLASLGANVLRFETAGIVALALMRAHLR